MTAEGIAKVTDFGLAAGRHQATDALTGELLLDFLLKDLPAEEPEKRELIKGLLRDQVIELLFGDLSTVTGHQWRIPGNKPRRRVHNGLAQVIIISDNLRPIR